MTSELIKSELPLEEFLAGGPEDLDWPAVVEPLVPEVGTPEAVDAVGIYLEEVRRTPLLTKEEESQLSKLMEKGRAAAEKLARGRVGIKREPELQAEVADGQAALDHLVRANLRLVISNAKRYQGWGGLAFLDLIQEGNLGLMRAAKKFDYRKGRFTTYATGWIKHFIRRAVFEKGRTIRIPIHAGEQIFHLWRAEHQLRQRLNRNPTNLELARELGIREERLREIQEYASFTLSLDQPVGKDGEATLGDFIVDKHAAVPERSAELSLLRKRIEKALEKIPLREAQVLRLRYGLVDGQRYPLRQIGPKLGISHETARKLAAQGLRQLRYLDLRKLLK